eukprot:Rmarinus@m.1553
MAGKVKSVQINVETDADLYRELAHPGLTVLEPYIEWCGPCICVARTFSTLYYENDQLKGPPKFLTCDIAKVKCAAAWKSSGAKPTFCFFKCGETEPFHIVDGVNAPELISNIQKNVKCGEEMDPSTIVMKVPEPDEEPEGPVRRGSISSNNPPGSRRGSMAGSRRGSVVGQENSGEAPADAPAE